MDKNLSNFFWDKIKNLIKLYSLNFLLSVVGSDFLSESELKFLENSLGKEKVNKYKKEIPLLDKIYAFGKISQQIGIKNVNKITKKDLEKWLSENKINQNEELNKIKAQSYLDVLSKQFKIEKDLRQGILNESNQKEFKMSNIVDYIKDKFEDWSFIKPSVTYVSESALNEGKAEEIKEQAGKYDENDPLVYKVPIFDEKLCSSCKKAYLDKNNIPKLFKLSELEANGTNIGKKQQDWLPIVPAHHPNCRCLLQYFEQLPNTSIDDYEFNEDKHRYILKEEVLKDNQKRIRKSKVKIIIGEKEFEV